MITELTRPRTIGAIVAVLAVVLGLVAIPTIAAAIRQGAMAPPRFVEEATAAGIDHVYDGDFEFFVGGGVAVPGQDSPEP